jgi:hypothetical protein
MSDSEEEKMLTAKGMTEKILNTTFTTIGWKDVKLSLSVPDYYYMLYTIVPDSKNLFGEDKIRWNRENQMQWKLMDIKKHVRKQKADGVKGNWTDPSDSTRGLKNRLKNAQIAGGYVSKIGLNFLKKIKYKLTDALSMDIITPPEYAKVERPWDIKWEKGEEWFDSEKMNKYVHFHVDPSLPYRETYYMFLARKAFALYYYEILKGPAEGRHDTLMKGIQEIHHTLFTFSDDTDGVTHGYVWHDLMLRNTWNPQVTLPDVFFNLKNWRQGKIDWIPALVSYVHENGNDALFWHIGEKHYCLLYHSLLNPLHVHFYGSSDKRWNTWNTIYDRLFAMNKYEPLDDPDTDLIQSLLSWELPELTAAIIFIVEDHLNHHEERKGVPSPHSVSQRSRSFTKPVTSGHYSADQGLAARFRGHDRRMQPGSERPLELDLPDMSPRNPVSLPEVHLNMQARTLKTGRDHSFTEEVQRTPGGDADAGNTPGRDVPTSSDAINSASRVTSETNEAKDSNCSSPGEDWFSKLFGFRETTYEQTKQCFYYNDKTKILKSKAKKDKQWYVGDFTCPSLEELRKETRDEKLMAKKKGTLTWKFVDDDIANIHNDTYYKDAVFQVASQFNCLEFVKPDRKPEDGVTDYKDDRTQGPACSLACGAATVYRNYFAPVKYEDAHGKPGIQNGQTTEHMINNLGDVSEALKNTNNTYYKVKNGYTFSDQTKLKALNEKLQKSTTEEEEDNIKSKLRIGVHKDVDVTAKHSGQTLNNDPDQKVTQVFASACSVAYNNIHPEHWEPFASLVLEASYEALFHVALQNQKSNKVVLTAVGGGAYGNDMKWIANAIGKALAKFKGCNLEVTFNANGDVPDEIQTVFTKHTPPIPPEPKNTDPTNTVPVLQVTPQTNNQNNPDDRTPPELPSSQ